MSGQPIKKGSRVTAFDDQWVVAGVFEKHVRIERHDEDGNLVFKVPSLERIVELTGRQLAQPDEETEEDETGENAEAEDARMSPPTARPTRPALES